MITRAQKQNPRPSLHRIRMCHMCTRQTPPPLCFSARLGSDAELYELAALVSDPGSSRQPVHADTPFVDGQDAKARTLR